MANKDYYEILGLSKTASYDDIKIKYRQLAMKLHPDRNIGSMAESEIKFKELQEAYACLSDANRREAYDSSRQHKSSTRRTHTTSNHIFKDIFESFDESGKFANTYNQQHNKNTQAQRHIITISLEDAYNGKQLRMPGNMTINIPQGVRTGTKFFAGQAIYQIDILPHSKFKRSNDDLLIEVEITAIEAILGLDAILTHLNSVILQFTIPPSIQNGQIVRLAGKGIKNPETDKCGDLMVRVSITIPDNLTEEQKSFLETMPHRKTFNI